MARSVLLAACMLFVPVAARADVVISEIMYNPDGSDTGREWVELFNAGTSEVVLIAGSGKGSWRIVDSSNHTFTDPSGGVGRGPLSIPPGGYLVVSSDPDTFIAEYGGSYPVIKSSISLNNTSGTVSVIDGAGETLDSAAFSKDMGGYDDGLSLQKKGASWLSASPTPGAATVATESESVTSGAGVEEGESETGVSGASGGSAPKPPVPQLYASAGSDRKTVVGADVRFAGQAFDKNKKEIEDVYFSWNFGDGVGAEGKEATHRFEYPGRYVVVLSVQKFERLASDTMIVTVAEPQFSLSRLEDGSVVLENRSPNEADVSGWKLTDGVFAFVFPPNSRVLPGASVRLSPKTLRAPASAQVYLAYPDGSRVEGVRGSESPAEERAVPLVEEPEPIRPMPSAFVSRVSIVPRAEEAQPVSDDAPYLALPEEREALSAAVEVAGGSTSRSSLRWWFAGIALAGFGALGAAYAERARKGEWHIIEETE